MEKGGDLMKCSSAVRTPRYASGLRLTAAVLVVSSFELAGACAAREHHVRGTVTVADSTRIEVRHKTGQVVSVALRPATTYWWDHTSASLDDVSVGARVMIVLDQRRGPFSAQEVRIFTRPPTRPITTPQSNSRLFGDSAIGSGAVRK